MSTLNEVKGLVSEGKTEEAIDLLQSILESKNDDETLNTVLLLESRYKTYKRKELAEVTLSRTELNDINDAILVLCSDLKKDDGKPRHREKNSSIPDPQSQPSFFQNPMVKYGAIGVGVLILISIIANSGGGENGTTSNNSEQQSQMNAPSTAPNADNGGIQWHVTPNKIILEEPKYNDIQIEVANISVTPENENIKTVAIKFKMTCIDNGIDECWESDLKYIFLNPDFQVKESVKSKTSLKFQIGQSWDMDMFVRVPIDMHNGSLDMYYLNKIKHTFQLDF